MEHLGECWNVPLVAKTDLTAIPPPTPAHRYSGRFERQFRFWAMREDKLWFLLTVLDFAGCRCSAGGVSLGFHMISHGFDWLPKLLRS